jgi:hypothetical protein
VSWPSRAGLVDPARAVGQHVDLLQSHDVGILAVEHGRDALQAADLTVLDVVSHDPPPAAGRERGRDLGRLGDLAGFAGLAQVSAGAYYCRRRIRTAVRVGTAHGQPAFGNPRRQLAFWQPAFDDPHLAFLPAAAASKELERLRAELAE